MTVLFIVLPLAVLLAGAAIAGFIWAARQGQFDDLETPAVRVAQDD
jgi:cbb3-type cytochrome oxidase maturation protein